MRWWKWLKQLFWEKEENVLFYMQGHDVLPQPLSREEEEAALIAWENGDEEARSRLIEHNLRLVVYIAKRYETNPIFMEALISIGSIGLIKAVNTFRRDKNIKLVTYASRCIENEILMYLRRNSKTKLEVSIDEPLNVDWDGNELTLRDVLGSEPDEISNDIEYNDEKELLLKIILALPEKERDLMKKRFGILGEKEHTQKELADLMGISQSYISRLEKRIILKIKNQIMKEYA